MGDLDADTALSGAAGRYRARLREDWRIWGPNGGYLAAVALRAAGRESRFDAPASLACHFLGVGTFDEVEVEVTSLRAGRAAEALRVAVHQQGRALLEALAWFVQPGDGLEHDHAPLPDVPPPAKLEPMEKLVGPEQGSPFPFWNNFESRPIGWSPPAEREPGAPRSCAWYRYRPTPRFEDPVVEACRGLILADTLSWPAACGAHRPQGRFIAPSLDLQATFHRPPASEWLLCETLAPVADAGLIGFRSQVWSEAGRLVASGSGTLLCRPVPASSPRRREDG